MEQHCETSDIFYLSAQTQWLPAEHFLNINNWDDSLKPSALYYIKQAEGWIASEENCTKNLSRNVSCTITNPLIQEENEATPSTIKIDDDKPKPHECSQCGKSFEYQSALTQHFGVHSGEKPFACHICGKTFSRKSYIATHLRIHSGEKLFVCRECEETFTEKGSLTRHLRIHSGEKPFACSQCGKTFTQKRSLTNHLRLHSGESHSYGVKSKDEKTDSV